MKKTLVAILAIAAIGLCAAAAHAAGVSMPDVVAYLQSPEVSLGLAGIGAAGITKYVQDGDVITITPAAAVPSGTGYLSGVLFGVAVADVAISTPGEFITEGVVDIAKTAGLAVTAGDRLFWDATNKCVNKTLTAQQCVGVATVNALAGDATVRMKLGAYVAVAT